MQSGAMMAFKSLFNWARGTHVIGATAERPIRFQLMFIAR
jgi:hypothetical protein